MHSRWRLLVTSLITSLFIAACGTVATPVWEQPTQAAVSVADAGQPATPTVAPTDTPVPTPTPTVTPPPTDTPVPATDTATPSPTPAPTDTPAEVASREELLVSLADPENGETLFNMFQADAGFACSTCHHADSEERLIGPGLLGIASRAETRVEGQSAVEYIYNSIVDPEAYIVETFPEGVMPQNWAEIYSEAQIYDIIAYLMTLE